MPGLFGSHYLTRSVFIACTHSSLLQTGQIAVPGGSVWTNPQFVQAYTPPCLISLLLRLKSEGSTGKPGLTSSSGKKKTLIFPDGSRKAYLICPRCSID